MSSESSITSRQTEDPNLQAEIIDLKNRLSNCLNISLADFDFSEREFLRVIDAITRSYSTTPSAMPLREEIGDRREGTYVLYWRKLRAHYPNHPISPFSPNLPWLDHKSGTEFVAHYFEVSKGGGGEIYHIGWLG
jgi:hypothetical protein